MRVGARRSSGGTLRIFHTRSQHEAWRVQHWWADGNYAHEVGRLQVLDRAPKQPRKTPDAEPTDAAPTHQADQP